MNVSTNGGKKRKKKKKKNEKKLCQNLNMEHQAGHASAASNDDGPEISRRVKVYWDGEGCHFQGTVTERDQQGRVKVCYDDGDEHWEDNWSILEIITPSDRSGGPVAVQMESHAAVASNHDGPEIGQRVKVYWNGEGRHYDGTVTERDQQGRVKVCYDDGDERWADDWSTMVFVKSYGDLGSVQTGSHTSASATASSSLVLSTTTASSSSAGQTITGTRCRKQPQRFVPELTKSTFKVSSSRHKRKCRGEDATGPMKDSGCALKQGVDRNQAPSKPHGKK